MGREETGSQATEAHRRRREPDASGLTDAVSTPERGDVGVRVAHDRFGGIDIPATLVGMLTALALTALLGSLVGAAIGAVGYQRGLDDAVDELSIASLAGGIGVLFVAFLIGGWAAARIARYDGARNGLMTGIWTLLLAAVLSAVAAWAGSEYDLLRNLDMPQWFSRDALTTGAIISGVVAVAAMLFGGLLGGLWGERYHRRADATIASVRQGGIERGVSIRAERR